MISVLLQMATALSLQAAPPANANAAVPEAPVTTGPRIPRAEIDESLEITGEDVKAKQIETRLTVGVMVNDAGPFRFLIDTGADRSVIGADLARQLGLEPKGTAVLHDMAGMQVVAMVSIDKLRVGSAEFFRFSAPALLESDLGAQGVLGIDALREQRVSMDFVRKTITVQDSSRPESAQSFGNEIVVTARRRNGQLIITEVNIGNNRLEAVIDSGAQISIGNSALRKLIFGRRRNVETIRTTLYSVTGKAIEADVLTLPELRVGKLLLRGVTMAFVDVPPFKLFGLADRPAILLGSDVLSSFRRVSMDFRRRKIRFVLR